jgi:dTDP-glucose pyrophosphorylase
VKVLVPMAGDSRLFEEAGHSYPKNLVEIAGQPLVQRVLDRVRDLGDLICLVREDENRRFHTADVIRLLVPGAVVVEVPALESGAACTALLAIDEIDRDAPLLVTNGDQIVTRDLGPIVADFEGRGLDGGVVTFRAVHPRWSYVKTDADGLVIEAAEKRPISTQATAGTYWFRRGGDFLESVMDMIRKDAHVDGRFYICPAYNEMILRQLRVGVHEIERDEYLSLATPQGVDAYAEHLG